MVFSLLNICLALSMASSKLKRSVQFVKYGAKFDCPTRPTISCDGRIEGISLELTHWNGNQTPNRYYADTPSFSSREPKPGTLENGAPMQASNSIAALVVSLMTTMKKHPIVSP
jgi:hypothetical protein